MSQICHNSLKMTLKKRKIQVQDEVTILSSENPLFQVQHIHYLSEHIGALFLNDEYSDVTLVVEHHRFHAHKVILAARSEYFRYDDLRSIIIIINNNI